MIHPRICWSEDCCSKCSCANSAGGWRAWRSVSAVLPLARFASPLELCAGSRRLSFVPTLLINLAGRNSESDLVAAQATNAR